jgi:hypothetical protein
MCIGAFLLTAWWQGCLKEAWVYSDTKERPDNADEKTDKVKEE